MPAITRISSHEEHPDFGLDDLLEDDRDRGAASGLAPARKLGQSALLGEEFMTVAERRALDRAVRPASVHPAVFRLEGALPEAPQTRGRRWIPVLVGAVVAAAGGIAFIVASLGA